MNSTWCEDVKPLIQNKIDRLSKSAAEIGLGFFSEHDFFPFELRMWLIERLSVRSGRDQTSPLSRAARAIADVACGPKAPSTNDQVAPSFALIKALNCETDLDEAIALFQELIQCLISCADQRLVSSFTGSLKDIESNTNTL